MAEHQGPESARIDRHNASMVTGHMRTAEDWHNGARSAMYRFGRHGCPPNAAPGTPPVAHALKFYEKLANEAARAIDANRLNGEGERLTALLEYAHGRIAEYRLLQELYGLTNEAVDLGYGWIAERLKETAGIFERDLGLSQRSNLTV